MTESDDTLTPGERVVIRQNFLSREEGSCSGAQS